MPQTAPFAPHVSTFCGWHLPAWHMQRVHPALTAYLPAPGGQAAAALAALALASFSTSFNLNFE